MGEAGAPTRRAGDAREPCLGVGCGGGAWAGGGMGGAWAGVEPVAPLRRAGHCSEPCGGALGWRGDRGQGIGAGGRGRAGTVRALG